MKTIMAWILAGVLCGVALGATLDATVAYAGKSSIEYSAKIVGASPSEIKSWSLVTPLKRDTVAVPSGVFMTKGKVFSRIVETQRARAIPCSLTAIVVPAVGTAYSTTAIATLNRPATAAEASRYPITHTARKGPSGETLWTLAVGGAVADRKKISCVRFELEPSFADNVQEICVVNGGATPAFELARRSWGSTTVKVLISLSNGTLIADSHTIPGL